MTQTNYRGLTTAEAERSREEHGANVYKRKKRKTLFRHILDNLKDPIIRILIVAMLVNLIFTIKNINWAENIGIVIAIAVSTVVSALSERGSEKAFEKMREEEKKTTVRVIRNGRIVSLDSRELVVGDLICLFAGNRIPADAELIDGELKVDQSAINGESKPANKYAKKGNDKTLYAGSMITEGEGRAIVKAVGDESVYGQIAKEIQSESEESPLKKRLNKLAGIITKIGYAAAALVAATYLFNAFVIDAGFEKSEIVLRLINMRYVAMHLIKAVTVAVTVIVVAVPEGLPMMISVVLSSNMKKMMKDNVLVRKPVGIETAGCINLLFTDKTGTLTSGAPVCAELIFANGQRYSGKTAIDARTAELIDLSIHANSSVIEAGGELAGGNGTERALYSFMPARVSYENIEKLPFDSKRKYSVCRTKYKEQILTLVKGAPERIISKCTDCLINGEKRQFDRIDAEMLVKKLSKEGKRILAFAYTNGGPITDLPDNMTFVAVCVLTDGIRKTAKKAVEDLKSASVHTVMITGDGKETAESVAKECGILFRKDQIVIEGAELANKTDVWIKEHIDDFAVVCRALPNDKNRLIKLSKSKGLIVGMTGDGINDAPALKSADVGFSMGSGSEIAKEAGDVIILDNDLSSIAKAVLYGRTIFKSIRKFITFQLIMNICAVGVTLLGQLFGIEHPITVVQMLWVNMIMDTLGGLAFAGEQPMPFYMKERPITREEPILNKTMLGHILIMGSYGMALCGWFLASTGMRDAYAYDANSLPFLTGFFALFIFVGVAICFTARSERMNLLKGLIKNKAFTLIMTVILIIQMLMLFKGGNTFRCVGMTIRSLRITLMMALSVFPIDFVRRWVCRAFEKRPRSKRS